MPTLVEVGPSVMRYAIRVPAAGELRFRPALHPGARAAGASASFRVTEEARAGEEQELWAAVLGPESRAMDEVRVPLRGKAGDIVPHRPARRPRGRDGGALRLGSLGRAARHGTLRRRHRRHAPVAVRGGAAQGGRAAVGLGAPNVLFVILDAARADHFGAYGYARPTTPNIDRFAREGVVFERAFTPAVYTLGAMSSVWTSQYPDRHHAEVSFAARLPADRLTLAELLGAQGIHTAGFVSNVIAGTFNGFDRGFAEFHEVFRDQSTSGADGLARTVPGWLAAPGRAALLRLRAFPRAALPLQPAAAVRHALRARRSHLAGHAHRLRARRPGSPRSTRDAGP